eukprot:maker-scaffold11_size778918-snap-gene-0.12 protein:Tk03651 transcript:maker-scaffold11_size778918-snap-gene-0.12-mRNA-1 annotation:"inner centromere"
MSEQEAKRVRLSDLLRAGVNVKTAAKTVEEVKKAKEMAHKARGGPRGDDEPDWQSNLSSWKTRRRKQSEETLMRVAEIKVLEDGDMDGQSRPVNLSKKLSGLLHTEEDDWSDLGLGKASSSSTSQIRRSSSKSPASPLHEYEEDHPDHGYEEEELEEEDDEEDENADPRSLERWTSATSLSHGQRPREPVRKKSSELSQSMKGKLEAFERAREEEERRMKEEKRKLDLENEHVGHFREKLLNFQKISTQTDLQDKGGLKSGEKKLPPPPISYRKLIEPQHYASSSALKLDHYSNDDDADRDDDFDKDLDDALEESYRSVLEEKSPKPVTVKSNLECDMAEAKLIFKDNDFIPRQETPPSEKPPPPPSEMTKGGVSGDPEEEEVDKQEREIIASLQKEEKEHKRYMENVQSVRSMTTTQTVMTRTQSGSQQINNHRQVQHEEQHFNRTHGSPVVPMPASPAPGPTSPVKSKSSSNLVDPRQQQQSQQQRAHPGFGSPQSYEMKANHGPLPQISPPKKKEASPIPNGQPRPYNQHWLVQEAEQRRLSELRPGQSPGSVHSGQPISSATPSPNSSLSGHSPPVYENTAHTKQQVVQQYQQQPQQPAQPTQTQKQPVYNNVDDSWKTPSIAPQKAQKGYNKSESLYANLSNGPSPSIHSTHYPQRESVRIPGPQVPPRNSEPQNSLLSVSGKKKCSHCKEELGRGAAMIIESLRLFYHLRCFQCCVCQVQLGNGSAGTDVRVRNNKLHCQNCYSNDEGLKFSKV